MCSKLPACTVLVHQGAFETSFKITATTISLKRTDKRVASSSSLSSIYDEYDVAHRSSERIKVKRACEESVQQLFQEKLQNNNNNNNIPSSTLSTTSSSINQIKRKIIAKLFSNNKPSSSSSSSSSTSSTSYQNNNNNHNNSSNMDLGDRVYAAERITKKRERRVSLLC